MKPRKPQPERDASFTKHTLCWDIGQHNWRATTAPNYRVCDNAGCKAVQRLLGGEWVYQFPNKPQPQATPGEPQPTILDVCHHAVIAAHAESKQGKALREYWQD
jgi:hypothetical protein